VAGAPSGRRANELDGRTWTRFSISVWDDIRKTPEELRLKHPALFPVALVRRVIQCFTNSDDRVVFDPFVGGGSTVIAAALEGKSGIGLDISREFCDLARRRLSVLARKGDGRIIRADAGELLDHVPADSADFMVTSPPYWDILTRRRTADRKQIRNYGSRSNDLGRIAEYEEFLKALAAVFRQCFAALRPGKYAVVVVMDLRKKERFFAYHSDIARIMQQAGFVLDDIIIWDRRQEYNYLRPLGYPHVFRVNKVHEFILIFQKPARPDQRRAR